jgi:pimeloyl-ACP methyl ester carboxylesterase
MTYFSGFCMEGESPLFDAWLDRSAYSISGFSYGAVEAFEYAAASSLRIDTLQLFAPAFFQTKPERYRTIQRKAFAADPKGYRQQFLLNAAHPHSLPPLTTRDGRQEELDTLLDYVWEPERLEALSARGTRIEVYLGGADRIIDSEGARRFFTPLVTVHWIRGANHFLQEQ